MKPVAAPLAIASAILVLSIALALVLIPMLDAELRRHAARKTAAEAAANDNARKGALTPERQVG